VSRRRSRVRRTLGGGPSGYGRRRGHLHRPCLAERRSGGLPVGLGGRLSRRTSQRRLRDTRGSAARGGNRAQAPARERGRIAHSTLEHCAAVPTNRGPKMRRRPYVFGTVQPGPAAQSAASGPHNPSATSHSSSAACGPLSLTDGRGDNNWDAAGHAGRSARPAWHPCPRPCPTLAVMNRSAVDRERPALAIGDRPGRSNANSRDFDENVGLALNPRSQRLPRAAATGQNAIMRRGHSPTPPRAARTSPGAQFTLYRGSQNSIEEHAMRRDRFAGPSARHGRYGGSRLNAPRAPGHSPGFGGVRDGSAGTTTSSFCAFATATPLWGCGWASFATST
jgi:hypothetical protein